MTLIYTSSPIMAIDGEFDVEITFKSLGSGTLIHMENNHFIRSPLNYQATTRKPNLLDYVASDACNIHSKTRRGPPLYLKSIISVCFQVDSVGYRETSCFRE